jgi:hypothetical protein
MASRRKPRVGVFARLRIIPNKNRRLQVAPTRRKLFGAKAKDEFLEWFAATCNCSLSARKAGFHYRTALRHWREDPVFGARCEEALRLGYKRLEELALRGAEAALTPKRRRRAVKGDRPAPAETLAMTPQDALQLLREHKRGLAAAASGAGAGRGKPGRAPTVASNNEVFVALVKRLKAFQIRVREEDAARAVEAAEPSVLRQGAGEPPFGTGEGDSGLGADPSTIRSADGPPPRSGEDQEGPPPSGEQSGEDSEERGA